MSKDIKDAFNEGAIPVQKEELQDFLKGLKGGKCPVSVTFQATVSQEDAQGQIDKLLAKHGGHVVQTHVQEFVNRTHFYLWTSGGALKELQANPSVMMAHPYKNWPHQNEVPKMKFKRI